MANSLMLDFAQIKGLIYLNPFFNRKNHHKSTNFIVTILLKTGILSEKYKLYWKSTNFNVI